MAAPHPRMHGLTHVKGGSDPIPSPDITAIQFDTSPQEGEYLETTTTGATGTQINAEGGDVSLNSDENVNLLADGVNVIGNGDGGVILEVTGDGDMVFQIHANYLLIKGLPTSDPGIAHAVWNNAGTLSIS